MGKKTYNPPYTITDKTINLISDITEMITKITINDNIGNNLKLRRENQIRTVHASLAIENNTLSLTQVTDIINGKRVSGNPDEIREVKNAFEAYDKLPKMNPYSVRDMLTAHRILMKGLTEEVGIFRKGGVGIFAGKALVHMAPPANRVPCLVEDLINWATKSEAHPLIQSCVFHYEFEFIHPFSDGNGRLGRMWQTLLLYQWRPMFIWIPVETLIKERQDEYYKVLGECDRRADSGEFIEFILKIIYDTLCKIVKTDQATSQVTDQVEKLLDVIDDKEYSAKDLMKILKLKHRPTFRENYLRPALELGYIEMTIPDKPTSSKQKYRKVKEI